MTLRNIFRGLCIASGAFVGVLAASRKSVKSLAAPTPVAPPAARRDYFSITRSRSKNPRPRWVLQGFGRFECFLLFDTWREAMDQATFRIENVVRAELIQLTR